MELLGGNAHLASQSELPAIGKAGEMCIRDSAKRFHTIGCSAQTRTGGEKYIQGKMDEAIEAEMCIRDRPGAIFRPA